MGAPQAMGDGDGAGPGAEAPRIQPLFPVRMEHEFPAPQETFEAVKRLILEHYYVPEISEEALYWAAIQGMLRHISPPDNPGLSQIWTAGQYDRILQSLEGNDASLGLRSTFNPGDGSLTVTEVLPNSPAEGLVLPGDRVLRVDGRSLRGLGTGEINQILNGEPGSQVRLTLARDLDVLQMDLVREVFHTRNLFVHPLGNQMALVELRYFSSGVAEELKEALDALVLAGVHGILLDLRNNAGGVFSEGLRVAHLFVPERGIVLRTFSQATGLQNYGSAVSDPYPFEIVVLANGQTASAAEMVVGALRDQRKSFVVGSRTFGKGVFERTFTLENDFRVKFITGVMYTPTGVAWQGRGIVPDFLVDQDAATVTALQKLDITARLSRDISLNTAVKLLRLRLGARAQP